MKRSDKQKPVYELCLHCSTGIPKGEILELKDAFDLLDTSSTGKIDANELKSVFAVFGVSTRNKSLSIAIEQAIKRTKSIDFSLFLSIFTAHFYQPKSRQSYNKTFKLFDQDNLGGITSKNLRRVVKELQLCLEEREIEEMIDRADADNDGVVSQQQFYQIMRKISSKV